MSKILGIDFGTTNCCMSIMDRGEPVILKNSEGARTTPSVVAFTKSGVRLVGGAAKRQAAINPQNTIFSVKLLMGRRYDEVISERQHLPFNVVKSANGNAYIQVEAAGRTKVFSPPEISAMILAKLKADAEAQLGEKITKAVIAVPAYFSTLQRYATKAAGEIAGFEVLRMIVEPMAAAIAYGLNKKNNEKIAVFDLGGGGLSISVLEIGDGVFEMLATSGEMDLGGDAWDNAVTDWICNEFFVDHGLELREQSGAIQRIREEAEKARVALTSSQQYELNLPFITTDKNGHRHIQRTLTRLRFDRLTDLLSGRLCKSFRDCLREAGLEKNDLNALVPVGGMTRVPKVIETMRMLIGKEPNRGVNPDEIVAVGAGIVGGILRGDVKDVLPLEATHFTLSLATAAGGVTAMIERNTTIPAKKSDIFSTHEDNQTSFVIKVLEGECPLARDNVEIGRLRLDGIPPAPRGVPQIEVTFDIDANYIIHVSAKDLGTGKEQKVCISGS